ncbi:MAG TPA: hypothetical protein VGO52_23865 [Hyphomonadaceae bacterium]|nr:hypothetical protein [Hyphomonadaceae bacterium]
MTSIVDINSCGPELAEKLALQIPTALYQKPDDDAMRAEVIYERERRHLKIVVSGDPGGTANLLSFIRIWQEQFG